MRYLFVICSALIVIISCKDKQHDENKGIDATIEKNIQNLRERADKNPDSLRYRIDLIDVLDSLGRYKDAITEMNVLLKKDSTNNSLWARNGQLQARAKDTAAAIESYYHSLNIYPDPDNQLYLAEILAERRDDRSLLLVNNVAQTQFDDETLANCDFIAGVYHARKGNMKMAEQLFNRCISRSMRYTMAYLEKGFLYFERKNYNEALKIFQLASNVDARSADAFYWQAKTFEALGKTQDAINMYKEALNLDPSLKEASNALARLGAVKS